MQDIQIKFKEQTEKYRQNFHKYGYSEQSMFMPSDRRVIRYYELLKHFEFFQKKDFKVPVTICDAGCGFGDINHYLQMLGANQYHYIGLDVVKEFMEEGKARYGNERVCYLERNFITDDLSDLQFDYAISSQTFTIPYTEENHNYKVIFHAINKLYTQCKRGVAFNFFTDQGDFQKPGTAYHNPAKLLEFAYTLSNNVVLDNSCFPYECTLTIIKDNLCGENAMIYDRFLRIHKKKFADGVCRINRKE